MAILLVSSLTQNLLDFLSKGANVAVSGGKLAIDLTANGNTGKCQFQCPIPVGNHWSQCNFSFSNIPTAEVIIYRFIIGGYANSRYVTLGTDGKLRIYAREAPYDPVTLLGTSTNALSANTTYAMLFEGLFATGSTITVYVDGVSFVTGSGGNTMTDQSVWIGADCPAGSNYGTTLYYDTFITNDNSGSTWNTKPTAQYSIKVQSSTGQGDYDQFTGVPEITNKYQNWDESPPNGSGTTDVDFNFVNTTNIKQTSAMPTASTMGLTGKTIVGVCLKGWGRRSDANKEHHGAMIRMDNTDILSGGQVAWVDTNYASSLYSSNSGFIILVNESSVALTTPDFDDWEIGWYSFTGAEAHNAAVGISTVWAEIWYFTPAVSGGIDKYPKMTPGGFLSPF